MNDDRMQVRLGTDPLPVRPAARRPWHTPKIEEVDYAAAESGVLDASSDLTGYGLYIVS